MQLLKKQTLTILIVAILAASISLTMLPPDTAAHTPRMDYHYLCIHFRST